MDNLVYRVASIPDEDGNSTPDKFYLRGEGGVDTEITQWQFDQVNTAIAQPAQSGSDIAALHAAQDPASDNFQGDPSTVGAVTPPESSQVAAAAAPATPTVVDSTTPAVASPDQNIPSAAPASDGSQTPSIGTDNPVQTEVPATPVEETAAPDPAIMQPTPTPDAPLAGTEGGPTVDLSNHPVDSAALVEAGQSPTTPQPAPATLTKQEEIDAWFANEEARIQAYLEQERQSLDNETDNAAAV
jgi:hypothetical protein